MIPSAEASPSAPTIEAATAILAIVNPIARIRPRHQAPVFTAISRRRTAIANASGSSTSRH